MRPLVQPVEFGDLPGWSNDDPTEIVAAMARCADHVIHVKPYRAGQLGVTVQDLMPALNAARERAPADAGEARRFFEKYFLPYRISAEGEADGFVTGYYEPEISVSRNADSRFRYPIYRRPDDLVDLDEDNRPASIDPYFAFGRAQGAGIVEYFDRHAIETGALAGRGLEIAYAESKVDLFFVHIQGAAKLVYPDGARARITYAAKTGHRFTPIGRILVEQGALARETVTMESIRRWLRLHPREADELMWRNRSFIFFRELPVGDETLGPVAAAKVPLSAGRSLAVDRLIHTFGTPFFISSPTLLHLTGRRPFSRLMLAQDTGSAIVGPARGDIFTGSGQMAGDMAGSVRHRADFFVLIPVTAGERSGR